MVLTVGKKLQQARQQKRLSIEEASRSTKIRPDRISDLEQDDFTHFPNLTYAKGFLLIYAKYLGVDVSEFASSFENTSQVSINNYEYLNNASTAAAEVVHHHVPSAAPSSSKLVVAVLALVVILVLGAGFIMFLNVTAKRLAPAAKTESASPPPGAAGAAPQPTPTPVIPSHIAESDLNALQSGIPASTPNPGVNSPPGTPLPVQPGATTRFAGEPEIRRPLPVLPSDNNPVAVPTPAPLRTNELSIQSTRKTWIQIQRDDDHSAPVFEDWIYPDARPLKVRGAKFWVQIRDPDAVKIWKDGQPVIVTGSKLIID